MHAQSAGCSFGSDKLDAPLMLSVLYAWMLHVHAYIYACIVSQA